MHYLTRQRLHISLFHPLMKVLMSLYIVSVGAGLWVATLKYSDRAEWSSEGVELYVHGDGVDAVEQDVFGDPFSGIEGEASALLAEVEVSEALVSQLHGTEAALEDKLERPPSGFSILDPGAAPELPEKNTMKPVFFGLFSILGVILGLAVVLWREFKDLRAETPAEVAFWGYGPVLGATGWPTDRLGLDELVAGLDDLAPRATGELLIIGGAPGDDALARELAHRMNEDWFVDRPTPREQSAARATQEPAPIQTPPPSGPYPIGGARRPSAAPAQPSTALALRPVQLVRRQPGLQLRAWDGAFEDQALRRAARLADRVVVLVRSGGMSALALNGVRRRVGRESGVGYVVLALPEELRGLPDRVGDVQEFWRS